MLIWNRSQMGPLRNGWLGIGTPANVKQDRANQENATSNLNNVFNYAMPEAKAERSTGLTGLGEAQAQFAKMANEGRAGAAESAAPAVNAIQDNADAQRRQEAAQGTARGGGTAEVNANADASTAKSIDDLLNETQQKNRIAGSEGEAQTGATTLGAANNLLGLGANTQSAVMYNADGSRKTSDQLAKEGQMEFGQIIGSLISAIGIL